MDLRPFTFSGAGAHLAKLAAGEAERERLRTTIQVVTGADLAAIDAAAQGDPGGYADVYDRVLAGGPLEWAPAWAFQHILRQLNIDPQSALNLLRAPRSVAGLTVLLTRGAHRPPRRIARRAHKRALRGR